MVSTRLTAGTGKARTPSRRGSPGADEQAVSRARWSGVALVLAALLGAITLAVISPSDPGVGPRAGVGLDRPTPEPTAIEQDGRIPSAVPEIIGPEDGITTLEREYKLLVTVPEYELPRDAIALEVYRNGKLLDTTLRPPPDDIEVGPIKLREGRNEITAALTSSSGPGPTSLPIVINVDKVGPDVSVVSPKENDRVFSKSITVKGTTEVGAKVTMKNATNDRERTQTVGPSGKFESSLLLEDGNNRIVIIVVDAAGNRAPRIRRGVTRIDPKPVVKLKLSQNQLNVSALPKMLTMTATALDSTGKAIAGAEIVFLLTVTDQPSRTQSAVTNERGQARWRTEIPRAGARAGEGLVSAEVTANGATGKQTKVLTLK